MADPLALTVLAGRYKVVRRLGEGATGVLHLAEDSETGKQVALKVLHPGYAAESDRASRFQAEALSASRVKHPNLLEIFDFGQLEDGAFYFAREFLEGNDLADELTCRQTLEPLRGLRIAFQICRALSAAHAAGVVHGGMKPESVLLQRVGEGEELVKIADLGSPQWRSDEQAAAGASKRRLTRAGMIFGAPEYLAPEQAGGRSADARADVYAVGVILFEMFTGAVPFTADTFLGVLEKLLNEAPPAMSAVSPELQISAELAGVVARALAKDPDARYASVNALSRALQGTPEGLLLITRAHQMPAPAPSPLETPAPQAAVNPERQAPAAPQAAVKPERQAAVNAEMKAAAPGARPAKPRESRAAAWRAARRRAPRAGWSVAGLVAVALSAGAVAAFVLMSRRAATVRLWVMTEPPGATLSSGGVQVCDRTPCELLAAPHDRLELVAVKDTLSGRARVLAERDQRVSIRLAAARESPK